MVPHPASPQRHETAIFVAEFDMVAPGPKPDGLIHQVSNANPDWATARTNNSNLAKGRTRS